MLAKRCEGRDRIDQSVLQAAVTAGRIGPGSHENSSLADYRNPYNETGDLCEFHERDREGVLTCGVGNSVWGEFNEQAHLRTRKASMPGEHLLRPRQKARELIYFATVEVDKARSFSQP